MQDTQRIGTRTRIYLILINALKIYSHVVTFGTLMMGGIITTSNPAYTANELAHQLKDSGAKAVITQKALLPVVAKAIKIAKANISDHRIVVLDKTITPSQNNGKPGPPNIRDIFSNRPFFRFSIKTESEAANTLAYICYSSGTTGKWITARIDHINHCISKF